MPRYQLHAAVRKGDLALVDKLLKDPAFSTKLINTPDQDGLTPVVHAVLSPDAGVEVLCALLQHGARLDARTLFGAALKAGYPEKVSALLEAGLDIRDRDAGALDAFANAVSGSDIRIRHHPRLIELLRLIIANGACLANITRPGGGMFRRLSSVARFDAVKLLLDAGADPGELESSRLMDAVIFGSLADVEAVIKGGADLEEQDFIGRTAWLLAVQIGDVPKAQLLFEHGANASARSFRGESGICYAIESGNAAMLEWLLEIGMDIQDWNGSGHSTLRFAVECGDTGMVDVLLKAGADVNATDGYGTILGDANTRAMAILLLNAGADPREISQEWKRAILGYRLQPDLGELHILSKDDFRNGRSRRFGRRNPEKMNVPFWEAMVRAGVDAGIAGSFFGEGEESREDGPIWCGKRFGQSLTALPDGRTVLVGGEHEDSCFPDFCIYNEVFVHGVDGCLTIYGYPRDVFPPTDFHTATLVGDSIYLIGSLGYFRMRRPGETPLYRLDTTTFQMESLQAKGDNPGWIYEHRAVLLNDHEIAVSGGKIVTLVNGRQEALVNPSTYILDIKQRVWRSG